MIARRRKITRIKISIINWQLLLKLLQFKKEINQCLSMKI